MHSDSALEPDHQMVVVGYCEGQLGDSDSGLDPDHQMVVAGYCEVQLEDSVHDGQSGGVELGGSVDLSVVCSPQEDSNGTLYPVRHAHYTYRFQRVEARELPSSLV